MNMTVYSPALANMALPREFDLEDQDEADDARRLNFATAEDAIDIGFGESLIEQVDIVEREQMISMALAGDGDDLGQTMTPVGGLGPSVARKKTTRKVRPPPTFNESQIVAVIDLLKGSMTVRQHELLQQYIHGNTDAGFNTDAVIKLALAQTLAANHINT